MDRKEGREMNNDLIRREALLKKYCKEPAKGDCKNCDWYGDSWCRCEIFGVQIAEAPAVDAVEVVRCRECNHCDPENYHCDHPMSTAAPLRRKPDDFCSYGEKRRGKDGPT